MLMSVCSLIKWWHFRRAERGSSVAEFLNILNALLCEEVSVTSPSSWLIYHAVTSDSCSVKALPLCCHTPARQTPGRTCKTARGMLYPSLYPAGDALASSVGPGDSPADSFSWRVWDAPMHVWHKAPFLPWARWHCSALQYHLALLWEGLIGSAPWFSFPLFSQRKCWAAPRTGRTTCSVVYEKAAAKYSCLNPILSYSRTLCIQTGASIRCTGNCQSELKALKGQSYNSVLFKCQDFVGADGGKQPLM